MLDVSKQAAIKVVDQMEQRGFLRREPSARDRRTKLLTLTAKGERVRGAALAESRRLERELGRQFGVTEMAALRTVLHGLLERHGALDDAAAGRARAAW